MFSRDACHAQGTKNDPGYNLWKWTKVGILCRLAIGVIRRILLRTRGRVKRAWVVAEGACGAGRAALGKVGVDAGEVASDARSASW